MQLIQFGDFTLDLELSLLMIDGQEQSIEPRLLELLLLFCQQPNQIINRQQILDQLWPGSIVTDNTINKMIANLRKELKDDPKQPQYIQTVPKRGYKLICPVEFKEPQITQPTPTITDNIPKTSSSIGTKKQRLWLSCLIIILFVCSLLMLWQPTQPVTASTANTLSGSSTRELTRMPGIERSPLMSEDQGFITFLHRDQLSGSQQLWRKDLATDKEYKVKGAAPNIRKLISLIGKKGQQLLYITQHKQQCLISRANWLNNQTLAQPRVIFDCSQQWIIDIAWSSQLSQLIYSAVTIDDSVRRIYRYDLATKSQQLLTQPETGGIGNDGLDISPDGTKLLIVNNDKDYKSQLFVLDLTTNVLTAHLKLDYNINEATWYHDSKHILYFAPPPSHQIIRSDLAGEQQQTLVSVSEYLASDISRINNGQDILFATANNNYNNHWLGSDNVNKGLNNSTVYDMLPALAHHSKNYAFISKRSGRSQLYYGDLTNGNSQIISHFENYHIFNHLSFSPDDKYLQLSGHATVWLLPVAKLLQGNLPNKLATDSAIFQADGHLSEVNWLSSELLYVRVEKDGRGKNYLFNKKQNKLITLEQRWLTLIADHSQPDVVYLLDKEQQQLYQTSITALTTDNFQQLKLTGTQLLATGIFLKYPFYALKIHQQRLHYITRIYTTEPTSNNYQLQTLTLQNDDLKEKLATFKINKSYGYDIADSGLIISELISSEGDIHRTGNLHQ